MTGGADRREPQGANAGRSNNDAFGNPSRNFENGPCDKRGYGVGYGAVLDDGTGLAPYQYKTTLYGQLTNTAVVNGIDARMVEAEARLAAGDGPGMMAILNALRAAPPPRLSTRVYRTRADTGIGVDPARRCFRGQRTRAHR